MPFHPFGGTCARPPRPVYPVDAAHSRSQEHRDVGPVPVYRSFCDFDGHLGVTRRARSVRRVSVCGGPGGLA
jgi:hypothetical protein